MSAIGSPSRTTWCAGHVDGHVADRQLLGGLGLGAPHPGPDPGHQLLGLERLDDVVVGARLQAEHDVDGVALGREHHDRHAGLGPDRPADVDAVHAGQHQVEQHDVRPQLADGGQRPGAVADHRGVEPLAPQHDRQHLGQRRVVVDHQNARLHAAQYPTSARQPCDTGPASGYGVAATRAASASASTSTRAAPSSTVHGESQRRRRELRVDRRRCAPAGRRRTRRRRARGPARCAPGARPAAAATARGTASSSWWSGTGHAEPLDLQRRAPRRRTPRRRPGAAAPRRRRRSTRRSGRRARRRARRSAARSSGRGGPAVQREQQRHPVHRRRRGRRAGRRARRGPARRARRRRSGGTRAGDARARAARAPRQPRRPACACRPRPGPRSTTSRPTDADPVSPRRDRRARASRRYADRARSPAPAPRSPRSRGAAAGRDSRRAAHPAHLERLRGERGGQRPPSVGPADDRGVATSRRGRRRSRRSRRRSRARARPPRPPRAAPPARPSRALLRAPPSSPQVPPWWLHSARCCSSTRSPCHSSRPGRPVRPPVPVAEGAPRPAVAVAAGEHRYHVHTYVRECAPPGDALGDGRSRAPLSTGSAPA